MLHASSLRAVAGLVAVLALAGACAPPPPEAAPVVTLEAPLPDVRRAAPAPVVPEPVVTPEPDPVPTDGPGSVAAASARADTVVGDGTAASCTADALAAAVRSGGSIALACGPQPVTIELTRTLHTCNTTTCEHPWRSGAPVESMTLDGGGLVTLSGGGQRGIFYANACEESLGWLTDRCQDDDRPHVTFRGLTFTGGNAQGPPDGFDGVGSGDGGGAIAMRSGTLTVEDVRFVGNTCTAAHPDGGGGAIRVVGVRSVSITGAHFEGNACANGGAISSLQSPMTITGSTLRGNTATGRGASSGQGGNGGAVYFDGTDQDVAVSGSTITGNVAPEGGSAVFYVSNDLTGRLSITGSELTGNTGQSFHTAPWTSIFFKGAGTVDVHGSTVE